MFQGRVFFRYFAVKVFCSYTSAAFANKLSRNVASCKYWQTYLQAWPWSANSTLFRLLSFVSRVKSRPRCKKMTDERFLSCEHNEQKMQRRPLSNKSQESSEHHLALSFILCSKYLMVLVLHQRIIHLSSLCTGIQRWEHCCAFIYIWHANMLSDFVFHSNFSVILSEKTSLAYSLIQYHCF